VLLAVDIGNTSIKSGLFVGSALRVRARLPSRRELTAAEARDFWLDWLAAESVPSADVVAAIVCSVVPALTPVIAEGLRLALGVEAQLVGPSTDTGIAIVGPNPLELGADRIVNAVAAWSQLQALALPPEELSGQLVVDLGTATKLDALSPNGEFLGGVIAPGLETSLEGLMARAAQLRTVPLQVPERVLGRSTLTCVQSGVMHGHASLIDGLVARLRRELPFPCEVLATGGYAPLIAPHTDSLRRVEPDLTLIGLSILHARTSGILHARTSGASHARTSGASHARTSGASHAGTSGTRE
jgi:type III pantothenate kinase